MRFKELAEYFKKLEETASRNAMTEQLAELFRHAHKDEIGKICYLLQGRVVPLYEATEFGVADKFVIRAIAQAYGVESEEVVKAFKKLGDLGAAAQHMNNESGIKNNGKALSVREVYEKLYAITQESGEGSQEKKITILSDILSSVDALSARYVVRIPLDKLRLGFSDMTMLDALSWMMSGDKSHRDELERAYNVRPDIGFIAETVKEKGITGLSHTRAKLGVPILAALCQRLPNADEMIKKMGEVAVEPKYDGVRIQIHYSVKSSKLKVQSYSRNLENTTAMFPELEHIGKQLDAEEVILDGEAIGMDPKTGKLISFQETMKRKRKHDVAQTSRDIPVIFFIFDVLYINGKDVLEMPLKDRRDKLNKIVKKGHLLQLSPQMVTKSPQEVREYHDAQLAKGLEGVVVKKWDSPYEPGRKGYSWVKFKEEEGKTGKLTDTIDAVIMGYTAGQGKRTAFGVGQMILGVRSGENFLTITKLGTGTTEAELKDLHKKLHAIRVKDQPKEYKDVNKAYIPDVWVEPKIVLEIAGDDLTKSPTHGAGYAVRFPRLVRIRTDKSPQQATTQKEIVDMFDRQVRQTSIRGSSL